MADFDSLLDSSWDDINEVLCPEGTWLGELVRIRMDKEDRQDRHGRTYRMVNMTIVPRQPGPEVDPALAEAYLAAGEAPVSYRMFIYGNRDLVRLKSKLEAIGVPLGGRSPAETLASYMGGMEVLVNVRHDTYQDETRAEAVDIGPPVPF